MANTVLLCILDGFGIGRKDKSDAVFMAKMTNVNDMFAKYPTTQIHASGEAVGLMDGQMGNSEVGHINIGAGRVVTQLLPAIEKSVKTESINDNQELQKLISSVKISGGSVHLIGLLSDGGVHSHILHIMALARVLDGAGVPVKIHAITDGRDVPPSSALKYFAELNAVLSDCSNVKLATISGRYYAMDRNENWDRVQKFYDAVVSTKSENKFCDVNGLIDKFYTENITDEFFLPSVASDYSGVVDGDAILIANFRADRARQLAGAFADSGFTGFARDKVVKFSACVGIAEYSEHLNQFYSVMFKSENVSNSLGEVIAKNGMKQLRIAETEKYAHVTFFFNGGEEKQFSGEDRILIPSPDVATFDLKPEMSAGEITDKLLPEILSQKYDLIVLNFANPDMVGHTGKIPQTVQALEFLDGCVGRVRDAVLKIGGTIVLTADHGNAEKMIDDDGVNAFTAHTINKVPLCIISSRDDLQIGKISLCCDGKLADIAPTILQIMSVGIPNEMNGKSLL